MAKLADKNSGETRTHQLMSLDHGCGLSVAHAARLFSPISLSSSCMLAVIAVVRSGCLEARSFFPPMSSARWTSMGFRFLFLHEEFSSTFHPSLRRPMSSPLAV